MVPLPCEATGLRPAIAVKELLRSLTEIDAAGALLVAGATAAGVEVVLLLLHATISSAAVVAATAVRPALADTENNLGSPISERRTSRRTCLPCVLLLFRRPTFAIRRTGLITMCMLASGAI